MVYKEINFVITITVKCVYVYIIFNKSLRYYFKLAVKIKWIRHNYYHSLYYESNKHKHCHIYCSSQSIKSLLKSNKTFNLNRLSLKSFCKYLP